MTLHPEIAKVLATLPEMPPGPLDPATLRAGEEAQVPSGFRAVMSKDTWLRWRSGSR